MNASLFRRAAGVLATAALVGCSSSVSPDSSVDAFVPTDGTIPTDMGREGGPLADGVETIVMPPDAESNVIPPDAGRFDDLIVEGGTPAEYSGVVFHLALEDRVHGVITRTGTFTGGSGGFMVFWPGAFDRDAFGMVLHVYADVNRDGACSSTDPSWAPFINNDFMIVHPVVFNLVLDTASMTTGMCAAFL